MDKVVEKNIKSDFKVVNKGVEKQDDKLIKKEFILNGLDCANCAAKIEDKVSKIAGIDSAYVNFLTKTLTVEINEGDRAKELVSEIKELVPKVESHVKVVEVGSKKKATTSHSHHHEHGEEHDHEHDHDHDGHEHGEGSKKEIIKFIVGAAIFGVASIAKFPPITELILYVISYIIVGGEIVLRALKNIRRGQVFDENFLMSIATIGAFAIGDYAEGVAVMLFYQVGE